MKKFQIIVFVCCIFGISKQIFAQIDAFDIQGQFYNGQLAIPGLPVVADMDGDGDKEIIFNDRTHIWVYQWNDNTESYVIRPNFPIEIEDENLVFECVPAVGRLEGLDELGIVIYGSRQDPYQSENWTGTAYSGRLYIYSFDGGDEPIAQTNLINGKGQPVLDDVIGAEIPESEDGLCEVIMYGIEKMVTYDLDPINDTDFLLYCWSFDGQNIVDEDVIDRSNSHGGLWDTPSPVAVGDMGVFDDQIGDKEMIGVTRRMVTCWTFDRTAGEFVEKWNEFVTEFGTMGGFFKSQPMLVDLFNSGNLYAIISYNRTQSGPTRNATLLAFDWSDGDYLNYWNGDIYSQYTVQGLGATAVCDKDDNGAMTVGMSCSSQGYWRSNINGDAAGTVNWPINLSSSSNHSFTSMARIGTEDQSDMRFIVSCANDDGDVYAFIDVLADGDDTDFELDAGVWTDPEPDQALETSYSSPVIADMDGNGTLDICTAAFNEARTFMRISVFEFENAVLGEDSNELSRIEWSQLGNGPRHTGLYAQPYAGHLPEGQTYWRDRVIVVSNVYCGHTDVPEWDAYLTIEDNSVIEFNDGKYVSDNAGYVTMGSNVVLKPNSVGQENDWCFIGQFFEWTDDVIINGAIELEEGGEAVFTNCTFINDDASGLTAFTAEDADVDFIDCVFKGYDTALLLDDCVGSIEGCTFEDMTYNAIEIENCTAALTIEECVFNDNGGAAMYFYNSYPDVSECEVYDNDCAVTGSAVYCYNSSPHMRDNDVHGNLYAGLNAKAGGNPKMTTWNLGDPHCNRFSGNNTDTHTPRADSTWAEVIQVSPTALYVDKGHNDFINDPGDYLISNHKYGGTYSLFATYNYWQTPGGLDTGDFYPSGSVSYSPNDGTPNYVDNAELELAAYESFVSACQTADSGQVEDAVSAFMAIVENYPATQAALSSLRQVYDYGRAAGMSLSTLGAYFTDVCDDNGANPTGVYSDRLANLCLVNMDRFEDAIDKYDDAMENVNDRIDSLYYAIDRAYAVLAQAKYLDGNQVDGIGNASISISDARRDITDLLAQLNGMPSPFRDVGFPSEYNLISAYPNPFNNSVTVRYSLNSISDISLQVYDITGRLVETLVHGEIKAGVHRVIWDASDAAGGLYLCHMQAGSHSETVKLLLIK